MEKLKQNKIIAILVAAIISVLIFIAVMIGHFIGNKNEPVTEATTNIKETTDGVVVDGDILSDEKEETESTSGIVAEVIKLQEPTTEKTTTTQKPTQNTNTVKPAEPVTQKSSQSTNYEVVEGGNDSVNEYRCGLKGHHCDSKETHDFIVSLEKKGCPYCSFHSCKSFYTYDEWGNACYDPTKCESYNAKSDPCEYCQKCGKKVGAGFGDTCVRFTVDTKCPECGKMVRGKTCHSH